MSASTTIRASAGTRDELRRLAEQSGRTMTDELDALVRAERQRRMGAALAGAADEDERPWLDDSAVEVMRAGR